MDRQAVINTLNLLFSDASNEDYPFTEKFAEAVREAIMALEKEKKKKVYISGAITGTNDYPERFLMAEGKLKKQGYSVINPAKVNSMLPTDTTYEQYMKMSYCMLEMCDSIYMLEGWEDSKGANREYGYAQALRMNIIYEKG